MVIEHLMSAGYLFTEAMTQTPAAGQQRGSFEFMFIMIAMIVVFYFLLIRPQNKRAKEHREMVSRLGEGDEVITTGGIAGKIKKVTDQYITVEIANGVDILVQRHHVGMVLPKNTIDSIKK